jgi:hypothetical protein
VSANANHAESGAAMVIRILKRVLFALGFAWVVGFVGWRMDAGDLRRCAITLAYACGN